MRQFFLMAFVALLGLTTGLVNAQANLKGFGGEKSMHVQTRASLPPGVIKRLPAHGLLYLTAGVITNGSAIIVDLDKGQLILGGIADQPAKPGGRPISQEKVYALAAADLEKLIRYANALWKSPRKEWGSQCGTYLCPPNLDSFSALWLADGDIVLHAAEISPWTANSEPSILSHTLDTLAYVELPKRRVVPKK